MRIQQPPILLPILVLHTLLAACSGGGPDPTPDTLNQGSFSIDDFQYQSPNGPDHQPLGQRVTAIVSNKEVAALDPGGGGLFADFNDESPTWPFDGWSQQDPFEHAASGQLDPDPEEEHVIAKLDAGAGLLRVCALESNGAWEEKFQLLSGGATCSAFAMGDVDGDGLDELAVVWSASGDLRLEIFDDGLLTHVEPLFGGKTWWDPERVGLGLADLDADGREEIVVLANYTNTWSYGIPEPALQVFDDAQAAHHLLVEREVERMNFWGGPAQLVLGDFDRGHAGAEIAVTRVAYDGSDGYTCGLWLQYETFALFEDPAELVRWRAGAPDTDVRHLVQLHRELGGPGEPKPGDDLVNFKVVAADFDGDGSDELSSVWFTVGAKGSWSCPSGSGKFLAFNIVLDAPKPAIQERWAVPASAPAHLPTDFPREWDGAEWHRVGSYTVLTPDHAPVAKVPGSCSGWPDFQASGWGLAAGDTDADVQDELFLSGMDGLHDQVNFLCCVEAVEEEGVFTLQEFWDLSMLLVHRPYQVLLADTDGDDIRLRYTGNKELALGNPLPIVLMAAPPTKQGISQKYGLSYTGYETSTGSGEAYSVKTGITAGMWAGYEVSDPFNVFGSSGKLKFSMEFARTETEAVEETVSENYSAGHSEDVVIFQGTLYESYEYEVVSAEDPSAVGQLMTIDVPVDKEVYKWSLENYNATVDPQHAIDPSVLGHTIGDPSSYMRKWDAEDLVGYDSTPVPGQGYVGWMSEPQTLGWASSSKGVSYAHESQSTTEDMLGWSVTAEQEFKAGAFVAGYSVGILQDYVHAVSFSETTSYHGEVGDVVLKADYDHWNYNFGLVVYTRGLHSNSKNEPIAVQAGIVPFQIETYYTEPIGAGY